MASFRQFSGTISFQLRMYLFGLLLCIALHALFTACTGTMSVQDAQKLAVQLNENAGKLPLRSLGKSIELWVDTHQKLRKDKLQTCTDPEEWRGDEYVAAGAKIASWNVRGFGVESYFQGNIRLAIRYEEESFKGIRTDWRSPQAISICTQAFYHAEAGDLQESSFLLNRAESSYGSRWSGNPDTWAGDPVLRARIRYNFYRGKGGLALAVGDFQAAESHFMQSLININNEQTLHTIDKTVTRWQDAWRKEDAQLGLARALAGQERLVEAEMWTRDAISVPSIQIMPKGLTILSEIFLKQGRVEDALTLAETSRNIAIHYCFKSDSLIRALARRQLARCLIMKSRWKEALDEFEAIKKEMATDLRTIGNLFNGDPDWGTALLMAGRVEEAYKQFEIGETKALKLFGEDSYPAIEMRALKAAARLRIDGSGSSTNQLSKRVPQLLEKWREKEGRAAAGTGRESRLKAVVGEYIHDLAQHARNGSKFNGQIEPVGEAFALANGIQTRSVGKAVASSAARSSVDDPELAKLIRQRQDLELRVAEQQKQLALVVQDDRARSDPKQRNNFEGEIRTLRSAITSLDSEVKDRFPKYSSIMNPERVEIKDIRKILTERDAFLFIYSTDHGSYIWSFGKAGPVAFHASNFTREQLAEKVAKLRGAVDPKRISTLGDIPDYDTKLAYDLYKNILKPVEKGWKDAEHLIVVADGALARLPVHILPTQPVKSSVDSSLLFSGYKNVPWLAKTHAVTVLPSVASLITLSSIARKTVDGKPFAGFGDPWFNEEQAAMGQAESMLASRGAWTLRATPKTRSLDSADISFLPRLPETADEVKSIALALGADPEKDTFTGLDASEKMVKTTDLSDRNVLVFATHGLVPNDLDGLTQPALALSSPVVTGDKENDGLLTMGEVMGLKLNADWVVLSACNTAAGEGQGAEAISGLGQAFFYAGARALLVTHWPVETNSAKLLTTTLFKIQAKNPALSRAEALQKAMLHVMNSNGNGFSYAHPIFWAPFALVGDGG